MDTCLGGKIWVTSMRPWRQTGHCHNEEPGKFFIALTIVFGGFQGWWSGRWHAQSSRQRANFCCRYRLPRNP